MSLAVAVRLDASTYAIGADGRVVSHVCSPHYTHQKTFRHGVWLGAWAGDVAAAQALLRALAARDGTDIEADLVATWTALLDTHGLRSGEGHGRHLDLDVLLVGPEGMRILRAYGAVLTPTRPYAAIGCADEYVTGWLDHLAAVAEVRIEDIGPALEAAARAYPGVGGPCSVLPRAG